MKNHLSTSISPKVSLFSAFIIHCSVEIPFFIFPVIPLLVGSNLFPDLGSLSWLGLGSLGTVGTLAAALPSPIVGRFADEYRRGMMMFFSLLLAILGSLIIGLLGYSFIVMLIGITLLGGALALYHPPGLSWISTAFEDPETHSFSSNYVKILALHGIGGSTGASLGPISVYFLINKMDWHQIYILWSIPLLIISICFWIFIGRFEQFRDPDITDQNISIGITSKSTSNDNVARFLFLIFTFICTLSLTRGMINFVLSPFLSENKNIEIATAALFIGVSTLIGAVGQVIGGYFGDKYGEKPILSASAIVQVIVLIGIYIMEIRFILLILYILLAILNALFWPSTNSLVAKNSQRRGIAFGWVMLVANFIGALGPAMDGILLAISSEQYLLIFIFASISSFIGFLVLQFLGNQKTL